MMEAHSAVAPTTDVVARLLREAVAKGQRPQLTIVSNSMSPLLRRGDRVQIASVGPDGPAVGDLVVVECPGALLTHRFWGTTGGEKPLYITRGDRTLSFDGPAAPQKVVGRVVARISRGQRSLALDRGAGALLSRVLARLSRLELHFFARFCRQPGLVQPPVGNAQPLVFSQLPQPRATSLLRRAFHACSWGIAGWSRLF